MLINNAGISGRTDDGAQDPTTLDLNVVRTVLDTNVFGVIRVTNAMLPLLRRADSPRIVNMPSNMGSLTLQTGPIMAAYAPSKSMLNSVTAQYARRLSDTNVIVNAGCPGYVATDFTGFNAPRTPEQGAAIAIRLATLPDDGPRGGFFDDEGVVPLVTPDGCEGRCQPAPSLPSVTELRHATESSPLASTSWNVAEQAIQILRPPDGRVR